MGKVIKKIFICMMFSVCVLAMAGCAEKPPKGMSDEMYGYTKEISVKVHEFLDGKIDRSDTKELSGLGDKMVELYKKEYDDGVLDEKYYNDKEAATLAINTMIYLYSEDSIDEVESTLAELDEILENK